MNFWNRSSKPSQHAQDLTGLMAALDRIQAVIWFDLDGKILDANQNFLNTVGYELSEIVGQHHSIFVPKDQVHSAEYKQFWAKLSRGETHSGKFERMSKTGDTIWIEASYNPVLDEDGNPVKVAKFAIDITETRKKAVDAEGQIDAISRSQAVIEFSLDGKILTANDNFLNVLGYKLSEVKGQYHRMFVTPEEAVGQEYQDFWRSLAKGQFHAGEYMRIAKDGSEVWIQASYNPIFDLSGRPVKVVKFASDVTEQKVSAADASGQLLAISKAQAVIEFDLKGYVLQANDNFLAAMGYSRDEVVGKHHSMFLKAEDASSKEYQLFWDGLAKGEFYSDEFRRVGKNGKDVWIQATYNPILGPNGKPYKVVKYAVDFTQRKAALQALVDGLSALCAGDLSYRLPDIAEGDFRSIYDSFNTTMVRLEELVKGILQTAVSIAGETECIAGIASDLATRSERQASSVEETSAAIEEISSTIKSTARNAEAATEAAKNASRNAQSGNGIVTEAIAAMQRIEDSAGKIGQVVEVIDGIAFQTNLLALNAGVEAARAGEAGSGFAVVASEVRALAQKAAESARQINELIQASNEEVTQGSILVGNSGSALEKIESGVDDVVVNINDIQRASQEQALGITEVTNSVVEIDGAIQRTAALAEESSAAASLLADRASKLRELVRYFNVREDVSSVEATPPSYNNQPSTPQTAAVSFGNTALAEDESLYDESGWEDF